MTRDPEDLIFDTFVRLGILGAWHDLQQRYAEPHRHYHTWDHVRDVLRAVDTWAYGDPEAKPTQSALDAMVLAAVFHDAVYDPRAPAGKNEEDSAELLRRVCADAWDGGFVGDGSTYTLKRGCAQEVVDLAVEMIRATATHTHKDSVVRVFLRADLAVLNRPLPGLLEWEAQVAREYQWVPWPTYVVKRCEILRNLHERCADNLLLLLAEIVEAKRPKIGVYAGSFNPFHRGHLDILEQAEAVFDKVIVAQGRNLEKPASAESIHDVQALKYREVETFSGLLTDYLLQVGKYADVHLVRGLRNGADLAAEMNMVRVLQDLSPGVKVAFFHCKKENEHISSSVVRQLQTLAPAQALKYQGGAL